MEHLEFPIIIDFCFSGGFFIQKFHPTMKLRIPSGMTIPNQSANPTTQVLWEELIN